MNIFIITVLVVLAIVIFFIPLFLYGIIGPLWLRSHMRRFMNFFDHSDDSLFPYDYSKPSKDALTEMVRDWRWPPGPRLKRSLHLIGAMALILLFTLLIGFFAASGGH
jgi:hypothetical protein